MASPFKIFRKNQKMWMVVITLMCMFAFVFIGQWSDFGGSAAVRTDPTVFTWKFGDVRQSEIDNRVALRQYVASFLFNAGVAANDPSQAMAIQQLIQQMFPVSEPAVIEAMVLEKKAQQLGIVVSDATINAFIQDWTGDKLRPEQLAGIVESISSRQGRISQAQLFDALRGELAALYVRQAFSPLLNRQLNAQFYAFRGDTPADRWEYFTRLNRKATAQVMPVIVEKFVAEIPDPSSEELQRFYDQYKNDIPIPASPSPGFKRPYSAQFEYVKANNAEMLKAELPKVTDQDIADYYEKYKDRFFKKDKPAESSDTADPAADDKPADTPQDTPAEKGDDKPGVTPPGKSDSGTDTSKADGKAGDAKSAAESDAKSAGEKSGEAKSDAKASGKSAAPKAGDAKKSSGAKSGGTKSSGTKSSSGKTDGKSKSSGKATDGKQSSLSPPAVGSLDGELLALADEPIELAQAAPARKGSTPAAKSDSKSARSEPKSSPITKSPNSKAADTKSSADSKASDTKSPEAESPDTKGSAAQTPAAGEAPATGETSATPPVEYEPLDEKLSETIRDRVAQERVITQVEAAFRAIQQPMDQYRRSLDTYRAAVARGDTKAKQPQPPDLAELAKQHGLERKDTKLVSPTQVFDYDIGKSRRPVSATSYAAPPFWQVAYEPGAKLYQAQRSDDNELNEYLWWKIAEEATHTPPLEKIKDEVVRAWKIIKARGPAEAQARKYAEQARKSNQTLKEMLADTPDADVSTAGPFSWLTRPPLQPMAVPRLTQVSGVELGGDSFMKEVFALKSGETGVAPNEPKTVYYVVQIESEEPPVDTLREEFMTAMASPITSLPYAAIGAVENANLGQSWFRELEREFDVKLAFAGQSLLSGRELE